MTVLVGIYCKDGIVIGSDSSTTFSAGSVRTIEQPTDKIDIIGNRIIVAGTGQVGLGQRFCGVVKSALTDKIFEHNSELSIMKELCTRGINDFASTQAQMGQYGALVAYVTNKKHYLCEFSVKDFQPELKTNRIWYVSMGSGQLIADPFLGFIREVFWTDGPPNLRDATFAVTWTLSHAINLNPGGIKEPISIAILEKNNIGDYHARIIDNNELSEHKQHIDDLVSLLRDHQKQLHNPQNVPDIPQIS